MKHKLFCFILILILILGSFAFVFADNDFYYPMISYDSNDPTYIATNYKDNIYLYCYSENNPIYFFYYQNGSNISLCFVSNYANTIRHYLNYIINNGDLLASGTRGLSTVYNSVYYYNIATSTYSDINSNFPNFSSLEDGLIAFDNYFQEQGSVNDTVFSLGNFVTESLQFVAATSSFIMQYPILMMFVLLPVISYIVILLRRLLLLGS